MRPVKAKYSSSGLTRQSDGSHLSHRLHTLGSLGSSESLRPIRRPESSSRAELCRAGMVLRGERERERKGGGRSETDEKKMHIFERGEQSRGAMKLF